MTKIDKWLLIGLSLSIIAMVSGYLLWVGFTPAENMSHLSESNLSEIQRELAVNYELGDFLLNAGFTVFSTLLLALLVRKVLKVIKK
ncbi:MAG: hypothetical protein JJU01_04370 [Alkalibacterium sp.]|nr:hypothetical protein [Alkalibacterium sp.]TVP91730.1 MAG: hypothetical protein EA249_04705 [Alkalibacterium sp.]